MVKHVTSAELEELIKNGKPVVCDFWAPWCGPCKMLGPVFESLSEKFEGRAEFAKVNVDENEAAAVKYGISSIPNVIVFKGGEPKANQLGFAPEAVFTDFLSKHI